MSSLLDELNAVPHSSRGPQCGLAVILAQMTEQDRADLQAALADTSRYTSRAIAAVLRTRLFEASYQTVSRHRRSDCSCR